MFTVLHDELFHKLVVMLYLKNMADQSILDTYVKMYSADIVQYESDGSELILVPIILELNEFNHSEGMCAMYQY